MTHKNKTRGLRQDQVKVGDKVRVFDTIVAYYSERDGNPKIELTPDIIGTVAAVRVPYPTCKPHHKYDEFCCIDFISPATGRMERAGVDYSNLQKVGGDDHERQ
jgi:hypothetical protein